MAEQRRPRYVPPPALCGFLVLLVLLGAVSYAVGRAAGPVAPGMHGPATTTGGNGGGGDADESGDGGMGDMHGGGH